MFFSNIAEKIGLPFILVAKLFSRPLLKFVLKGGFWLENEKYQVTNFINYLIPLKVSRKKVFHVLHLNSVIIVTKWNNSWLIRFFIFIFAHSPFQTTSPHSKAIHTFCQGKILTSIGICNVA